MAKFEEGDNTGSTARKLIKDLDEKVSQQKIANAINRSVRTVQQIKSGAIENPPKSVVEDLRKLKRNA